MIRFRRLAAGLLAVLCAGGAAGADLRILDATGSGLTPLREGALQYSLGGGGSVTVNRLTPDWAIEKLLAGDADLAVLEEKAIPADFNGLRRRFAVEALAVYVNSANSLRKISAADLRQVLAEDQPTWRRLNDDPAQIHRYSVKPEGSGSRLAAEIFGRALSPAVFKVGSAREAVLLTASDPAGLAAVRFLPEPPAGAVALAVDGVLPLIKTIKDGSYPLRQIYWVIVRPGAGPAAASFLRYMAGNGFYDLLLDDGLFPVFD